MSAFSGKIVKNFKLFWIIIFAWRNILKEVYYYPDLCNFFTDVVEWKWKAI
jgi:hypothetical protein